MRLSERAALTGLLAVLAAPAPAQAQNLAGINLNGASLQADAVVTPSRPTSANLSGGIWVGGTTGSLERDSRTWVRYNLRSGVIPSNGFLYRAHVFLTQRSNVNNQPNGLAMSYGRNAPWGETTITWNNRPYWYLDRDVPGPQPLATPATFNTVWQSENFAGEFPFYCCTDDTAQTSYAPASTITVELSETSSETPATFFEDRSATTASRRPYLQVWYALPDTTTTDGDPLDTDGDSLIDDQDPYPNCPNRTVSDALCFN